MVYSEIGPFLAYIILHTRNAHEKKRKNKLALENDSGKKLNLREMCLVVEMYLKYTDPNLNQAVKNESKKTKNCHNPNTDSTQIV